MAQPGLYATQIGAWTIEGSVVLEDANTLQTRLCPFVSPFFRTVRLEVDYAWDVLNRRPFVQEALHLVIEAYRSNGIDFQLVPQNPNPSFAPLPHGLRDGPLTRELAVRMASSFDYSQAGASAPSLVFQLLVLASGPADQGLMGIMFDVDNVPREGAAIFLDAIGPAQGLWERSRYERTITNLAYTIMHEIGHALNLVHTFEINRPDSLSVMNYPQNYIGSRARGSEAFWKRFNWRFDSFELVHLWHATPAEILPTGQQFGWANYHR